MFCEDADDLNYWESVFVDETWVLRSDTYNLKTGGEQNIVFSEEVKRKIGDANRGKRRSDEFRRKRSEQYKGENNPHYGKHLSEETRRRISESLCGEKHPNYGKPAWNLGKHHTDEARRKMSEALKGENHPLYGKHLSDETKQKIRESKIGQHHSEESRLKMSYSRMGKKNHFYGKHHSEESKRKNRESHKGLHWWNNGVKSVLVRGCPGDGFVRGRL